MDRSVHPPIVHRLHYEFDGWLGDVLLESFPCFIVTRAAAHDLQNAGLSGATFDEVCVTTSDQFEALYPNRQLPPFMRLKVTGIVGKDDFSTALDGRLVVSEAALGILNGLRISNAVVSEPVT